MIANGPQRKNHFCRVSRAIGGKLFPGVFMRLHFLGANRQVTGSRYCLETDSTRVMIDCGMFQEREFLDRNWAPSPLPAGSIDALLLTHVHIDHCGLLPRLAGEGFQSPIYATRPSAELLGLMLRDAAEIQEENAAYKLRRHEKEKRKGPHPVEPLYTQEDVDLVLPLVQPVNYGKSQPVGRGVTARFHDAGHILGSAYVEVQVGEGEERQCVLFSGDLGQHGKPLVRDPAPPPAADYLILESTYGDRTHAEAGDIASQLAEIVNRTARRGGNVVIPTFAVERAQELLYFIGGLIHEHRIPQIPVYLDSPMAVDVTAVFLQFRDCFDKETWELLRKGGTPFSFPGLNFSRTVEQSRAINKVRTPCIIMATSGMCNAGRIKHHLRQNLGRPESTVLFVGYQGHGTLGRQIVDGAERVRIHGREYTVRAEIARIYGFSGHADRTGLLNWVAALPRRPKHIFLTHGELQAAEALRNTLVEQGHTVSIPRYGETVEL